MCNCNCNNAYVNTNCQCKPDCTEGPCGCKTSSDEVVYIGPTLECTGIENCDTLTEALTKIDEYVCGDPIIEHFIDLITNNPELNEQFIQLVTSIITCDVIWSCATTTTTTTCPCNDYHFVGPGVNGGTAYFVECGNTDATIIDLDDIIQSFCVDNAYPILLTGLGAANNQETCCGTTTTTTTVVGVFNMLIDVTAYGATGIACAAIFNDGTTAEVWCIHATPQIGDFLYTDPEMTTKFHGIDTSYKIKLIDDSFVAVTIAIFSGIITAQQIC